MKALDLFCGAGGASMGLHQAGYDVTGVDVRPQPNYPFRFIHADALEFPIDGYDLIWASPPCQRYMQSGMVNHNDYPDLIESVRERLRASGSAWIIENVPGAPLQKHAVLCGSMFGLQVRRHRVFELSKPFLAFLPPCDHSRPITGVYGHPHGKGGAWRNGKRPMLPSDLKTWSIAMGIDWMHPRELAQAIPPAYSRFLAEAIQ